MKWMDSQWTSFQTREIPLYHWRFTKHIYCFTQRKLTDFCIGYIKTPTHDEAGFTDCFLITFYMNYIANRFLCPARMVSISSNCSLFLFADITDVQQTFYPMFFAVLTRDSRELRSLCCRLPRPLVGVKDCMAFSALSNL